MNATSSNGVGRVVVGLLLIVLGAFALLGGIFDFDIFSITWPLFIVIPGLVMFAVAAVNPRSHTLAVPGSIVTTTGLLLWVQQVFDIYATWAYAWALIAPMAVGFGIWFSGRLSNDEKARSTGIRLMAIGGILFIAGFFFFELILNISGFVSYDSAALVGGLLLVAAGGLLIFRSTNRTKRGNNSNSG